MPPPFDHRSAPAVDQATDWLRQTLANGPVAAGEVRRLARDAGLACTVIYRARDRMGLVTGGGRWMIPMVAKIAKARRATLSNPDSASNLLPRKAVRAGRYPSI
jgi:hypothetical protein